MRIIAPDEVVFGVDNLEGCRQFISDYGLIQHDTPTGGYRFEAQDGTGITIERQENPDLPPALPTGSMLRQTIWGCEDQDAVEEIEAELSKDREVTRHADRSISCLDDVGFAIAFRATRRRPLDLGFERVNSPGSPVMRPANVLAQITDPIVPRTLGHVVYFTPDSDKMEAFFVERLNFVVTDRFTGTGPFLRSRDNYEHHSLFLIQTPPHMQGLEHIAFHVEGPTEVMTAGSRMLEKGYESFWGPGRHVMGSNWFWYFNSPMGFRMEYDADMDQHDENWVPRELPNTAETAQTFLFRSAEKFLPGGD